MSDQIGQKPDGNITNRGNGQSTAGNNSPANALNPQNAEFTGGVQREFYDRTIERFYKRFRSSQTSATQTNLGGYEDPTYLGVHNFMITLQGGASPLFANEDITTFDFEAHTGAGWFTAKQYLNANGYYGKAKLVDRLRDLAQEIFIDSPYYIKSISGLKEFIRIPEAGQSTRVKDRKIEIEFHESVDYRVSAFIDTYRKIVYDFEHLRYTLPQNLRWFQCIITLKDPRLFWGDADFNLHILNNRGSTNANQGGAVGLSNIENQMSVFLYNFTMCEFDFTESFPAFDTVTNELTDEAVSQKLTIIPRRLQEHFSFPIHSLELTTIDDHYMGADSVTTYDNITDSGNDTYRRLTQNAGLYRDLYIRKDELQTQNREQNPTQDQTLQTTEPVETSPQAEQARSIKEKAASKFKALEESLRERFNVDKLKKTVTDQVTLAVTRKINEFRLGNVYGIGGAINQIAGNTSIFDNVQTLLDLRRQFGRISELTDRDNVELVNEPNVTLDDLIDLTPKDPNTLDDQITFEIDDKVSVSDLIDLTPNDAESLDDLVDLNPDPNESVNDQIDLTPDDPESVSDVIELNPLPPESVGDIVDLNPEDPESVTDIVDLNPRPPESVGDVIDLSPQLPESVTDQLDLTASLPESVTDQINFNLTSPDSIDDVITFNVSPNVSVNDQIDFDVTSNASVNDQINFDTTPNQSVDDRVDLTPDTPTNLDDRVNLESTPKESVDDTVNLQTERLTPFTEQNIFDGVETRLRDAIIQERIEQKVGSKASVDENVDLSTDARSGGRLGSVEQNTPTPQSLDENLKFQSSPNKSLDERIPLQADSNSLGRENVHPRERANFVINADETVNQNIYEQMNMAMEGKPVKDVMKENIFGFDKAPRKAAMEYFKTFNIYGDDDEY